MQVPMPPAVPIRISREGQIVDRAVGVRKGRKENVRWQAQDGGGPWTIKFNKVGNHPGEPPHKYPVAPDSPFSTDTYYVPEGGSAATGGTAATDGPVKGDVGTTYRYIVISDRTGMVTDDPDVDVEG
jgi:hypothetical protein